MPHHGSGRECHSDRGLERKICVKLCGLGQELIPQLTRGINLFYHRSCIYIRTADRGEQALGAGIVEVDGVGKSARRTTGRSSVAEIPVPSASAAGDILEPAIHLG